MMFEDLGTVKDDKPYTSGIDPISLQKLNKGVKQGSIFMRKKAYESYQRKRRTSELRDSYSSTGALSPR